MVSQGVLFFNDPPQFVEAAEQAQGALRQLGVLVDVQLKRLPRQRCVACGNRRVVFVLSVSGVVQGQPLCAKDAGIR